MAGAGEVSDMNIQCRPPAVDGRRRIMQADDLRERTIACKPEVGGILGEVSRWIRQFENIQATRLAIIQQQVTHAGTGEVCIELLLLRGR